MPTLSCNSTFNMKVFEFESSILNFYFKLNTTFFLNNMFEFKHANFGRYLSLVMLEYYLASKNHKANASVEDYILNSIRNDLDKDGFIVVLKDSDKNVTSVVNSLQFNDILPYTRKSNFKLKVTKTQDHYKKDKLKLSVSNINKGTTDSTNYLITTKLDVSEMRHYNDLLITELETFLMVRENDMTVVKMLLGSIKRINEMALHKYRMASTIGKQSKLKLALGGNAKSVTLYRDLYINTRTSLGGRGKTNHLKKSITSSSNRYRPDGNKMVSSTVSISDRNVKNKLLATYNRNLAQRNLFTSISAFIPRTMLASRSKENKLITNQSDPIIARYYNDKTMIQYYGYLANKSKEKSLIVSGKSILAKSLRNSKLVKVKNQTASYVKAKKLAIEKRMLTSTLKQRIYKGFNTRITLASKKSNNHVKLASFDFLSSREISLDVKMENVTSSNKDRNKKVMIENDGLRAKYSSIRKVLSSEQRLVATKYNLFNLMKSQAEGLSRLDNKNIRREKVDGASSSLERKVIVQSNDAGIKNTNIKLLLDKINELASYNSSKHIINQQLLSMNYVTNRKIYTITNTASDKYNSLKVLMDKISQSSKSKNIPVFLDKSLLSDRKTNFIVSSSNVISSDYLMNKIVLISETDSTSETLHRTMKVENEITSLLSHNKTIYIEKEFRADKQLKVGGLDEEQFYFEKLPPIAEVIIKELFATYDNASIGLIDTSFIEAIKEKKEFNLIEQKLFNKFKNLNGVFEKLLLADVEEKAGKMFETDFAVKLRSTPSVIQTLTLFGYIPSKLGKFDEVLMFDKYMQGYLHEVLIGDLVNDRYGKFLEYLLLDKKLPQKSEINNEFLVSAKDRLNAVNECVNLSMYAVQKEKTADIIDNLPNAVKESGGGEVFDLITSLFIVREGIKYNIIQEANRQANEAEIHSHLVSEVSKVLATLNDVEELNTGTSDSRLAEPVIEVINARNTDRLATSIKELVASRNIAKADLVNNIVSTIIFDKGTVTELIDSTLFDRYGTEVIESLDAQIIDGFGEYIKTTLTGFNPSAEGAITSLMNADLTDRLGEQVMMIAATRFEIFGDELQGLVDAYRKVFNGHIKDLLSGERKVAKGKVEDDIEVVAEKPSDFATTILLSLGLVDKRTADHLSQSSQGFNPDKIGENLSGSIEGLYKTHEGIEITGMSAEFKNHIAVHLLNTIFAGEVENRLGSMVEMYENATRLSYEGEIDFDLWSKFANLLIKQGIMSDSLLARDFTMASTMLENIVGTVAFHKGISLQGLLSADMSEKQADLDNEEKSAFLSVVEAIINKEEGFAVKEEKLINLLDQVMADKELTISLLTDVYDWALRDNLSEADNIEDHIFAVKELKDSLIDADSRVAQGLIYNYDDIIIDRESDPEFWEGGYFVPIDYDPNDPFNLYYPYAVEQSEIMLSEYGWVEIESPASPAEWIANDSFTEFSCIDPSADLTGFYLNNFNYDSYSFDVDIVVDDVEDEGVGVIVNYKDAQNYYYFMVSGGDSKRLLDMPQAMQLYRVYNGVTFSFGSALSPAEWISGQILRFNVLFNNNNLKVKVNGILQYDINID